MAKSSHPFPDRDAEIAGDRRSGDGVAGTGDDPQPGEDALGDLRLFRLGRVVLEQPDRVGEAVRA
jgi:hypothetical protein